MHQPKAKPSGCSSGKHQKPMPSANSPENKRRSTQRNASPNQILPMRHKIRAHYRNQPSPELPSSRHKNIPYRVPQRLRPDGTPKATYPPPPHQLVPIGALSHDLLPSQEYAVSYDAIPGFPTQETESLHVGIMIIS